MLYRNPRFAVLHAGYKAGGFTLTQGTEDAGTPISRLIDKMNRRLYRATPTTSAVIFTLDQGSTSPDRETINRLIIPAPHTLAERRLELIDGDSNPLNLADGTPVSRVHLGPSTVSLDLEDINAQTLVLSLLELSTDVELPELIFTRHRQAASGVAPPFTPGVPERVGSLNQTQGGQEYSLTLGESKQRYRANHNAVDRADFLMYQDVVNRAQEEQALVWYDHPASGANPDVLLGFDDLTAFSVNNGTPSLVTGYAGEANGATRVTSDSLSTHTLVWNPSAPLDLRNADLYIDMRVSGGWVAANSGLQLRVSSGATDFQTRYLMGDYFLRKTTPEADWWRIWCRPSSVLFGSKGPVDLANVTRLDILFNPAVIGDWIEFDNFAAVREADLPRPCRFVGINHEQDHPVPNALSGPTYKVTMDLVEVTT